MKLYNENGSRNIAAERQLEHLHELENRAEALTIELARKAALLDTKLYVPPSDLEARQVHEEAQRMAAGLAHEVIASLRLIMLHSKRPNAQLDAAKALFEIGSRVGGTDGKAGALPGAHVVVIERSDMVHELAIRKKSGAL